MRFDKFARSILWLYLIIGFIIPFFRWQPLNYAITALLLIVNLVCVFSFWGEEKRSLLRWLGAIILVFCGLTIFNWLLSPKNYYGYSTSHEMTGILVNLTTFFLVYQLRKRGAVNVNRLNQLVLLLFIITIPAFFVDYYSLEFSEHGNSANTAYPLVYLFFLLSLTGYNVRNNLFLIIIFGLVIFSAKRGAIICVVILTLFYLLFQWNNKRASIRRIVLIPIVAGTFLLFANYIYENNENLQLKVEGTQAGNYSGRDYINETLLLHFYQLDTEKQLFGSAFAGSVALLEMDAHNDYIETLIGQGIVGLALYIAILLTIFVISFRARSYLQPIEKFILFSGFVIWCVRAYYSQTVYSSDIILYVISFAFIIAGLPQNALSHKKNRRNQYIKVSSL